MSNDKATNVPREVFVLIPQEILEAAAAGAREQIRLASARVPALYKSLLEEVAKRFLDPHLDRKKLWKRHGLNDKNQSKQLTKTLGDSFWSLIRKLRVETASHLLADPRTADVHLYIVALATGFRSSCALNAAFKAWSGGVAPSEYRKLKLAEPKPRPAPAPAEKTWEGQPRAAVSRTLQTVYQLATRGELSEGAFDSAFAKLREADSLVKRHRLADLGGDVAAHYGLLYHCRGALGVMDLDLDGAYVDFAEAAHLYASVPRLPRLVRSARERILYSDDTQAQLLKKLCLPCRTRLLADGGRPVREHLYHALSPIPRDLEWFGLCCDECYRTVWGAIEKARLGLIDDAWRAAWLVAHADPVEEAPPSLARYLRALHESEALTHEEQLPRLELCRAATVTARALGDPIREAYALCFVANALRVMASFTEARQTLQDASEHCLEHPWSAALLAELEGRLAAQGKNWKLAFDKLNTAGTLYQHLDVHLAGYVLTTRGELAFNEGRYEAAVRSFEQAAKTLDRRRAPVLVSAAIPINLAAALGALGRQAEAKVALGRSEFDRTANRGFAATELLVSGCLALAEKRREEALGLFAQAASSFEALDRLREKALAIAYSVEAYAGLGKRAKATARSAEALRLFQELGCKEDTFEAFAQLNRLLGAAVLDAATVANTVRCLTKAQGGWLP